MEIEVGTFNNAVISANVTLPIIVPALWNTIKTRPRFELDTYSEVSKRSKPHQLSQFLTVTLFYCGNEWAVCLV
jgi:hypothetical protein